MLKLIAKSSSAFCDTDPAPTWLIKKCLDILITPITKIVNLSLSTGVFPRSMKQARVKPLIKNHNLDCDTLENYRPVSNLSFLSKIVERAVTTRLNKYLFDNNLDEPLQSAYKSGHSTETALLRVKNDIMLAVDGRQAAVVVLLDLSAAFDTVDHAVLLSRLESMFGVKGTVLKWFQSYLTQRSQAVSIDNALSDKVDLLFGVPQY